MYKVSVMYPYQEGARFDIEYYRTTHMQLVEKHLKPLGLIKTGVDKGISGGGDAPPPYACIGHLYFEKTYAGLFDNSKIRSVVPEFKADLSLNAGLRIIVDWWEKDANTVDPEKDALEDKLVSLWNSWADQLHDLYTQ